MTTFKKIIYICTTFCILFAVWWIVSRLSALPSFILPSPREVGLAIWNTRGFLGVATLNTLKATFLGLGIAILIGLCFAILIDLFTAIRLTIYPLLVISQTVQILAIAPLIVIWFGFGIQSTIFVVALFCFFPMTIAMVQGLSSTDPEHIQLMRAMHAMKIEILRFVRVPAAMPAFFAGLRLSVTYSVIAATIGEWIAGYEGLGLYMLRAKNALRTDQLFAGMLITSGLSVLLFLGVVIVEKLTIPWYYLDRR